MVLYLFFFHDINLTTIGLFIFFFSSEVVAKTNNGSELKLIYQRSQTNENYLIFIHFISRKVVVILTTI